MLQLSESQPGRGVEETEGPTGEDDPPGPRHRADVLEIQGYSPGDLGLRTDLGLHGVADGDVPLHCEG